MSVFNTPSEKVLKPESVHPWAKTIKDEYSDKVKRVHNSINNVVYPKPKKRVNPRIKSVPLDKRVTFTVVGNRVTKEFIYCAHLVQNMHKYRPYKYNAPVVQGCNGVEWADHLTRLKLKYGGALRHCLENQVAVMCNDKFIGGEGELKKMIESEYFVNMLALNYQKESIKQFSNFIRSTGSPCVYLHISIDKKPIGSLIFMLYSSIVPRTCENFLRLCRTTKGGYSGTPVHRVVKEGWIQCGGYGLKSEDMECENFIVPFDRRGVIGMANDGRHFDCSTQFFVLLQPCPALSFRYVAFGQLIEGEETLKKIEEVETYYEAPKSEITIYNAGIVNLECMKKIAINKNCREYIENHIDDLIIIGEMFYEMLMVLVFLEAEFRELQRMEETEGENHLGAEGENYGGAFDDQRNYIPDNIHATQRFMRKKDEPKKQLYERNQTDRQGRTSPVAGRPKLIKLYEDGDTENNDFDVETVSAYVPEEYVYPITPPTVSDTYPKPTIPYYIALTDNPYPGEVDSNFDLKKFLQGNYCFEQDLDMNRPKTVLDHKKWSRNEKIKAVSQIITSYEGVTWFVSSSSSATDNSSDLNTDEEDEIRNYLIENSEKACFSGRAVKQIARANVNDKPIDQIPAHIKFTDEELRRIRMAIKDYNERNAKKVSIGTQPWEVKKEIKRKQTGWGAVQTQEVKYSSSSSESSDGVSDKGRKLSVQINAEKPKGHVVQRRQTGYVSPKDFKKQMQQQEEEEEEETQHFSSKEQSDNRKSGGVWIAPENLNKSEMISRPSTLKEFTKEEYKARPSVLMRLYDDVAVDEHDTPTLKDYKPAAEMAKKKEWLPFEDDWESPFFRKQERALLPHKEDTDIPIPDHEHHKKKKPLAEESHDRIETGYFGKDNGKSLQTLEFARKRPSISIAQYQIKNKLAEEKMKQEAAAKRGIRLPGDSPVYEHLPSENKLYSYGSMSVVEKAVNKLQGT